MSAKNRTLADFGVSVEAGDDDREDVDEERTDVSDKWTSDHPAFNCSTCAGRLRFDVETDEWRCTGECDQ